MYPSARTFMRCIAIFQWTNSQAVKFTSIKASSLEPKMLPLIEKAKFVCHECVRQ